MFDSLNDRIKRDEATPRKERLAIGAAIILVSVALFGGLYLLVQFAE